MKYFFLLLLFGSSLLAAQTEIFAVEIIETDDSAREMGFYKLEHYTPHFYEDENYVVTSECHGEFGGEVSFKNKHNNKVTVASAVCPLIINKLNSKYYLTTSLAHMGTSYHFYEIEDPNELEIKNDTLHYNDTNTVSGMKLLSSGHGKTILLSFSYKEKIYQIVCDTFTNENYIAVRDQAQLKKVQLLSKLPLIALSNDDAIFTNEGHYACKLYLLKNQTMRSGYIDIYENKIKIYLCKE